MKKALSAGAGGAFAFVKEEMIMHGLIHTELANFVNT